MHEDPHGKVAILIVEDDPSSRANTALLLELEGFAVLTAANGIEGLAAIRKHHPALVICDVMMPGMNGMALLETVRKTPEIADTPFLFLTALTDYSHLRSAMNAGADDYLTKPYAAADLLGAVMVRLRRLAKMYRKETTLERAKIQSLLSKREWDVLELVGLGMTSQQIADNLSISRRTVDSHRAHIIEKLDVDNAGELIRLAVMMVENPD